MASEVAVLLERKGPVIDLDMESLALGSIHIDHDALPPDERVGSAQKLLAASALFCYVGALDKALQVRGIPYVTIRSEAVVRAGQDEQNRSRILGLVLDVVVCLTQEQAAAHAQTFERVVQVMRKGCLVTASLADAFPVTYNLSMEVVEQAN